MSHKQPKLLLLLICLTGMSLPLKGANVSSLPMKETNVSSLPLTEAEVSEVPDTTLMREGHQDAGVYLITKWNWASRSKYSHYYVSITLKQISGLKKLLVNVSSSFCWSRIQEWLCRVALSQERKAEAAVPSMTQPQKSHTITSAVIYWPYSLALIYCKKRL